MNKEQALKLLLDSIETDERFLAMEYEGLFREKEDGIRLISDFTLFLNGKVLFSLAPEEICRKMDEPILDTLIERFSNILSTEMIDLNNVRVKVKELERLLQLKEERMERQGKKPNIVESQKKSLMKEVAKLKESRKELLVKMERLYEVNPQLQLFRSLEQLRNDGE